MINEELEKLIAPYEQNDTTLASEEAAEEASHAKKIEEIRGKRELNLQSARAQITHHNKEGWPTDFKSQLILTLGLPTDESLKKLVEFNNKVNQHQGEIIVFQHTYELRGLEKHYLGEHAGVAHAAPVHQIAPPPEPIPVDDLYVGRIKGECQLKKSAGLASIDCFVLPVERLFPKDDKRERDDIFSVADHLLQTLLGVEATVKVFFEEDLNKMHTEGHAVQGSLEGRVVTLVSRFQASEKKPAEEEIVTAGCS
jgi:hypothetical protein